MFEWHLNYSKIRFSSTKQKRLLQRIVLLRSTHLRARDCIELGAIFENHISAITSHGCVKLGTKAARLRQTPFAATSPAAIIHHRGINSLAHHRFRLNANVESSEITLASLTHFSDYPRNKQRTSSALSRIIFLTWIASVISP